MKRRINIIIDTPEGEQYVTPSISLVAKSLANIELRMGKITTDTIEIENRSNNRDSPDYTQPITNMSKPVLNKTKNLIRSEATWILGPITRQHPQN